MSPRMEVVSSKNGKSRLRRSIAPQPLLVELLTLNFYLRQSSGLPTVKTASFYLFGKYFFRFFSRTWGHPKKST